MSADSIKIVYVDHDGTGFAETLILPVGTVISTLFFQKKPDGSPGTFQIRVRRGAETLGTGELPLTPDFELKDGDRVAFTPSKIVAAL